MSMMINSLCLVLVAALLCIGCSSASQGAPETMSSTSFCCRRSRLPLYYNVSPRKIIVVASNLLRCGGAVDDDSDDMGENQKEEEKDGEQQDEDPSKNNNDDTPVSPGTGFEGDGSLAEEQEEIVVETTNDSNADTADGLVENNSVIDLVNDDEEEWVFNSQIMEVDDTKEDEEQEQEESTIITDGMRKSLIALSYLEHEIDSMKPNIADTVIRLNIPRPIDGMPKNWSKDEQDDEEQVAKDKDSVAAYTTKMSSLQQRLKQLLTRKAVKKIFFSTVGVALFIGLNTLYKSNSSNQEVQLDTDDTTTASGSIADNDNIINTTGSESEEQQYNLTTETNDDDDNVNDESWLDKLITRITEKFENFITKSKGRGEEVAEIIQPDDAAQTDVVVEQ